MITQEQLKEVVSWSKATPNRITTIFKYYKELMNPSFNGCSKCPSSIRQAHNGLKAYYKNNYGK
jgi:hypothetical protein